jgi:pantetheine-phosphate adenylyltransferase
MEAEMLNLKELNKKIDLNDFLKTYKVSLSLEELKAFYSCQDRFYYTFERTKEALENLIIDDDALIMAILFQDVLFDSQNKNYRETCSLFFENHCGGDLQFIKKVKSLINHEETYGELILEIKRLNSRIIKVENINILLEWERAIFKEYQHLDVTSYKHKRISFLNKAYKISGNVILLELRDIIKQKEYKIGFYPGSFNPFHIGHYNILKKSEKYFDKVVIGVGVNYEKRNLVKEEIPYIIKNRQIIYYSGLITTELEKLRSHGEVFVVRGLRNAYDLQHEEGLRNVIKDFFHNQEFVYYFCDKEYEHISSSLIRDIQSRGKDNPKTIEMLNKYTFPIEIEKVGDLS